MPNLPRKRTAPPSGFRPRSRLGSLPKRPHAGPGSSGSPSHKPTTLLGSSDQPITIAEDITEDGGTQYTTLDPLKQALDPQALQFRIVDSPPRPHSVSSPAQPPAPGAHPHLQTSPDLGKSHRKLPETYSPSSKPSDLCDIDGEEVAFPKARIIGTLRVTSAQLGSREMALKRLEVRKHHITLILVANTPLAVIRSPNLLQVVSSPTNCLVTFLRRSKNKTIVDFLHFTFTQPASGFCADLSKLCVSFRGQRHHKVSEGRMEVHVNEWRDTAQRQTYPVYKGTTGLVDEGDIYQTSQTLFPLLTEGSQGDASVILLPDYELVSDDDQQTLKLTHNGAKATPDRTQNAREALAHPIPQAASETDASGRSRSTKQITEMLRGTYRKVLKGNRARSLPKSNPQAMSESRSESGSNSDPESVVSLASLQRRQAISFDPDVTMVSDSVHESQGPFKPPTPSEAVIEIDGDYHIDGEVEWKPVESEEELGQESETASPFERSPPPSDDASQRSHALTTMLFEPLKATVPGFSLSPEGILTPEADTDTGLETDPTESIPEREGVTTPHSVTSGRLEGLHPSPVTYNSAFKKADRDQITLHHTPLSPTPPSSGNSNAISVITDGVGTSHLSDDDGDIVTDAQRVLVSSQSQQSGLTSKTLSPPLSSPLPSSAGEPVLPFVFEPPIQTAIKAPKTPTAKSLVARSLTTKSPPPRRPSSLLRATRKLRLGPDDEKEPHRALYDASVEEFDEPLKYQFNDNSHITITPADKRSMNNKTWVNDTVIDFFLKYFGDQATTTGHLRSTEVFMLLAFVFTKIMASEGDYTDVLRWVGKATGDLFQYESVVLPVNQRDHWYSVVITGLPGLVGKKTLYWSEAASVEQVANPEPPVRRAQKAKPGRAKAKGEVPNQPAKLFAAFQNPHKTEGARVVENVEVISSTAPGEGSASEPLVVTPSSRLEAKPIGPRTGAGCRIYVFDSLGIPHPKIAEPLREFLAAALADRHKARVKDPERDITFVEAYVPDQKNYIDCGIRVISTIETFLEDPRAMARFWDMQRADDSFFKKTRGIMLRERYQRVLVALLQDQIHRIGSHKGLETTEGASDSSDIELVDEILVEPKPSLEANPMESINTPEPSACEGFEPERPLSGTVWRGEPTPSAPVPAIEAPSPPQRNTKVVLKGKFRGVFPSPRQPFIHHRVGSALTAPPKTTPLPLGVAPALVSAPASESVSVGTLATRAPQPWESYAMRAKLQTVYGSFMRSSPAIVNPKVAFLVSIARQTCSVDSTAVELVNLLFAREAEIPEAVLSVIIEFLLTPLAPSKIDREMVLARFLSRMRTALRVTAVPPR